MAAKQPCNGEAREREKKRQTSFGLRPRILISCQGLGPRFEACAGLNCLQERLVVSKQ